MFEKNDIALNCGKKETGDFMRQRGAIPAALLMLGWALSGGPFVGESLGGEVWVANMK
ncbi:MAG: hypothetical protein HY580_05290, partial [Nitrospinae bacterium]|nr:hypothetical protein [Nitrospinota bacterium]